MERQHVPLPRPASQASSLSVPVVMRQVLLVMLVAAFALLGGRPAAAPVTAMPMVMASEICHDDGGTTDQDHGGACLFCHLLGATGPQDPATAGTVLRIRFVRLVRPAGITLMALRPLRRDRVRDPPRSGSAIL